MLRVRNFVSDESGVTAIEYALIASLIAVAIIGIWTALLAVGLCLALVFMTGAWPPTLWRVENSVTSSSSSLRPST